MITRRGHHAIALTNKHHWFQRSLNPVGHVDLSRLDALSTFRSVGVTSAEPASKNEHIHVAQCMFPTLPLNHK